MKKIRINELARELEVKAHEILDRLTELGVTEKKTHSSSIDEDVAIKLRRLFGHEVPEEEHAEPEAPAAETQEKATVTVETLPPVSEIAPAPPQTPASVEEQGPEAVTETATPGHPAVRPSHPIRPPLAGSQPPAPSAPPAP